jgi:hypothetical protein
MNLFAKPHNSVSIVFRSSLLLAFLLLSPLRQSARSIQSLQTETVTRSEAAQVPQKSQSKAFHLKPYPKEFVEVVKWANHDSKDWIDELEIHLKNVSNRPIYYLRVALVFPELGGNAPAEAASYGRERLSNLEHLPDEEDKPWPPGEVQAFKLPEFYVTSLKKTMQERGVTPFDIKRIDQIIDRMNLGDRSGWAGGYYERRLLDGKVLYGVRPLD